MDMNRHIQSIYSVHDATSWQKGAIGSLGYEVSTKANIIFILSRGRKYDKKSNDLNGGLSLYATGPDEIIHEYVFNDADWSWEDAFTFPITQGSGGGGEASIWSRDSFAYLFTSISTAGNENQAITLWWRDYAGTVENKANAWHQGPTSPTLAARQGGMCGQYAFAFQGADGAIRGSNFTQLDRPSLTRWDTVYDITGNESVLEGTGLSCWYFFPNTTMFHVFYQIKQKSAIREAIRDWGPDNATVPGIWRFRDVPIY